MASKVESYIELQVNFKEQLTGDLSKLGSSNFNEHYVQSLLKELEAEFSSALARHKQVLLSKVEEAKIYLEDDVFGSIRMLYHTLWSKLHGLLPKQSSTSTVFSSSAGVTSQYNPFSELMLPKVELPTFNGSYADWMAFDNMFTATVHNNLNMEPIVKLQRLKAALSGDAELVVKNLELNSENYTVARELLANRYQHTRRLVNSYLKKLYEFPVVITETASTLRTLLNTLNDCSSALKQLKLEIMDYQLVFHMCRKLPQTFLTAWEESQGSSTDLPTFEKFRSFLETRFRMMEMIEPSDSSSESSQISEYHSHQKNNVTVSIQNCILCNEKHPLFKCSDFNQLSQQSRFEFITKNNLCENCLHISHTVQTCRSFHSCRVCGRRHHTLLHSYAKDHTSSNSQEDISTCSNSMNPVHTNQYHSTSTTGNISFLGTAQVKASSLPGLSLVTRTLIDPCSDDNYILESTVRSLQLMKYVEPCTISVLGEKDSLHCKHRVDFNIQSLDGKFLTKISAAVVNEIASNLPPVSSSLEGIGDISKLCLADTGFNQPGPVSILLGIDVYTMIRLDYQSHRLSQSLFAENTLLGYVIRGNTPRRTFIPSSTSLLTTSSLFERNSLEETDSISNPISITKPVVERKTNPIHQSSLNISVWITVVILNAVQNIVLLFSKLLSFPRWNHNKSIATAPKWIRAPMTTLNDVSTSNFQETSNNQCSNHRLKVLNEELPSYQLAVYQSTPSETNRFQLQQQSRITSHIQLSTKSIHRFLDETP